MQNCRRRFIWCFVQNFAMHSQFRQSYSSDTLSLHSLDVKPPTSFTNLSCIGAPTRPSSASFFWKALNSFEFPWTPIACFDLYLSWKSVTCRDYWEDQGTDVSIMITCSAPDFLLTSRLIWYFNVSGSFLRTYSDTSWRSSITYKEINDWRQVAGRLWNLTLFTFPGFGVIIATKSIREDIMIIIWHTKLFSEDEWEVQYRCLDTVML